MKKKINLQLRVVSSIAITTLLIIASLSLSFTALAGQSCLVVTKTVKDNGNWVNETTINPGETVRFNISITYNKIAYNGYKLYHITIVDTLPFSLEYNNNATTPETSINGKNITWDLTGVEIYDGESFYLEFNATAIGYGQQINKANVSAYETCPHKWHYADAYATVNILGSPTAVNDTASTDEDTLVWIDVLNNDYDVDGTLDPSTVTVVSSPSNGNTNVNTTTGEVKYTPNPDFHGTDTFDYTVDDNMGLTSNTATVTINVNDVNDPPTANDDTANTDEDIPIWVDVTANDTDTDGALDLSTLTVTNPPSNGITTVNTTTGEIQYIPDTDFHGQDTYTYQIADDDGATDTATVTIIVTDVNDPPVAVNDTDSTDEDNPVWISVISNDNDVDGTLDLSTLIVVNPPSNGGTTVNSTTGEIQYIPDTDFHGQDTYTYQIADDDGATDTATVTIIVTDVNDPPVAVNDTVSTDEDIPVWINVLSNDNDVDGALDPSTVSVISGPSNGNTNVNTSTGEIEYAPDADFHGTDSFVYQVCDDDAACDTATVTITINDVNDPPVANNDMGSTDEDNPVWIDVLNNDYDVDGTLNLSSISITNTPNNGSTIINYTTGEIQYIPNINFYGVNTFKYTVKDNDDATSNEATVTILISGINDPPVANDDYYTTPEDTTLNVAALGVLANDTDPDIGYILTAIKLTNPNHGTTSLSSDGSFIYIPDPGYHGSDIFTYQIFDGLGGTDTATVYLTITDINDPPVALDDTANTDEDILLVINVSNNDYDNDGTLDFSSISIISSATHGNIVTNTNGTITYTPNAGYHGTDSLTYTIKDDDGATSNTATVTINVNDVNDPPTANDDTANTDEDTSIWIDVLNNDSDVDGTLDPSTVTVIISPSNGNTNVNTSTGEIEYTPDADFHGTDSFVYQVCDDDAACDTATVTITINDVNDPPTANDDTANTDEDTPIWVDVTANDTDTDGTLDLSTLTVTNPPSNGITTVNTTTGEIKYMPNADFHGTDSFNYTIDDDDGATSNEATVAIIVNDINDPPIAYDDSDSCYEDSYTWTDVIINDIDIDGTLDFSSLQVTSSPSHGNTNVNISTGKIEYTPDGDWNGIDSYVYQIADDDGATDTATVTIIVTDVNDPPVAVNDTDSTDEDNPVWISVISNDNDVDGTLDLSTLIVVNPPSNGGTTVNSTTGEIQYIPDTDFHGQDTYTYQIADDDGATDTATVTIIVTDVNDPPVAVNDTVSTDEDIPVWINVLSNDNDVDGALDPSTVSVISGPSNGNTNVNTSTGEIEYAPDADFHGTDSFVYQVCDDDAACDTATVTITINDVNDPPVANNDMDSIDEDTVAWIHVLGNDNDVDGNLVPSTVSVISSPSNGNTNVNTSTGEIEYTPDADFHGTDSFNYTVDDDNGATSNEATVTIIVNDVNDPPTANDDITGTNEDTPIWIGVLANDSDVDGTLDPNSVMITSVPNNGSTVINFTTGEIEYTPGANYFGSDSFNYTIKDDDGAVSNEATVNITINSVNDPPIANDDYYSTLEDTTLNVAAPGVLANDTDPDTVDTLNVTKLTDPSHGTVFLNSNGSLNYTPFSDYHGSDNFTYQVSDGHGETDTATVHITVIDVNDPPVANFTWNITTPTDMQIIQFNDTSYDLDDGYIERWHWEFSDPHPSDEQNPLHLFIDNSIYTVTLTVWDDDGASNSTSKNVTVVNIPPTADFICTSHSFGIFEDVYFTDNSTDVDGVIVNWTWNFGDGNTSHEQNPVYNYSKNGNFTITSNVTDDDGATDTATTQNITILNSPPVADFTWNPSTPTDLQLVQFTDNSTDSDGYITNWTWNFGDGNHSYNQHPTHQYADNGTYQVTLTVRDNNNESNTTSKQIVVDNVPPTSDFTYEPSDPSTADLVNFTDNSTDLDGIIVSWLWDFGDGNTSTNQNSTHQYGASGNYTVTLTVTDNDGATDSSQKTVNVSASPVARFICCPTDYNVTVNESVIFFDQSYDPDGYIINWTWNFGDGNYSYGRHPYPVHAYAAVGTYIVNLTVTDNSLAINSTSKEITVTSP